MQSHPNLRAVQVRAGVDARDGSGDTAEFHPLPEPVPTAAIAAEVA